MEEGRKFECKKCGECCHYKTCLPLTEWEAKEIQKIAKEKNVVIDIRPLQKATQLDKKSGKIFCIKYGMFNTPCPFLSKDNNCSIYEHRPIRCKQFPILHTPFSRLIKSFSPSCFMKCKNFDHKELFYEVLMPNGPKQISKQEIKDYSIDVYGIDIFIYALQDNMASEYIMSQIAKLSKEKKVKLRSVSSCDIEYMDIMPSLDFLKFLGVLDENGKISLIAGLKDTERLKEKIKIIKTSLTSIFPILLFIILNFPH